VSERTNAPTGIAGLDDILNGGLALGRHFLLEGSPGTGKTTIALQFLQQGLRSKQQALYITLSETREELIATAVSHGWTFGDELEIFELQPPENILDPDEQQSILYSSDLELGETTQHILATIERVNPSLIYSTAFPKFGCWRRARCGIAVSSSHSSTSLQSAALLC
jgi:circadian clock protein KaiC